MWTTTSAFAVQSSKMIKLKTIQKPEGNKGQHAKGISPSQNTQIHYEGTKALQIT
jgi:hypothetical protein